MVSNGPFKLKEWKINKHVLAVKNDKYWDAPNVTLKCSLPIEKIETEKTILFKQIDMTGTVPQIKINLYEKEQRKTHRHKRTKMLHI